MTKYSALDVMKQALELLFEFAPSEKNYREAMRTIQVYSEGDHEMVQTLKNSFRFIANAVYSAYEGQRRVESIGPETLFLEGLPFDPTELQQAFRFVGVKPPDPRPSTVKKMTYLDEGFEPYKQLLEGKIGPEHAQVGRELHWVNTIHDVIREQTGHAVIRVGSKHLEGSLITRILRAQTGQLIELLRRRDIEVKIVEKIADVNEAFGKR